MAVDASPPPGTGGSGIPIPLDPLKLTQAYRQPAAVVVPEVATGRRSPLAGHNMPPIDRLPSKFAVRRDLQRLIREDGEQTTHRPPTPARPSLPQLDGSMCAAGGRREVTGSRAGRSRSEPRTDGEKENNEFEQVLDMLDASVRSDVGGWRNLRGRLIRHADDSQTVSSAGAVRRVSSQDNTSIILPPIVGSGKQTPVKKMSRQETQRILSDAKGNLESLEASGGGLPAPVAMHHQTPTTAAEC